MKANLNSSQLNSNRLVVIETWIVAMVLSMGCLISVGCDRSVQPRSTTSAGTVKLEVLVKDGKTITVDVPVSIDSTVFNILERAQNLGDLKFESTGAGETAFVTSIDGVKNLGASGHNWVFKINGELAKKGCGVCKVKRGDQIQWFFGDYELDDEADIADD